MITPKQYERMARTWQERFDGLLRAMPAIRQWPMPMMLSADELCELIELCDFAESQARFVIADNAKVS